MAAKCCASVTAKCCSSLAVVPMVERHGQLFLKLNDGNEMPMVGLGTWQADDDSITRKALRNCINAGYRLIDTAWWYSNEEIIGDELQKIFKEGIIKREDIFITTKLHPSFMGRDTVVPQLKIQLEKLKLDYVDLFLVHWPMAYEHEPGSLFPLDPETKKVRLDHTKHYTQTWKGMEDVKRLGLAKSIGISNHNIRQVEDVLLRANIRPSVLQIESHPYLANRKLIEFCQLRQIAITAYSPLANPGNSWAPKESAKYPKPMSDEKLTAIGKKYGKTPAHVMLRWQIQRGVSVIPKSVNEDRLKANLNIFDFTLSPEDMEVINAMDQGTRMCPFVDCGNSFARDYPFDEYRFVVNAFE